MRWRLVVAFAMVVAVVTNALPVKEKKEEEKKHEEVPGGEEKEDWELNLEYGRYLKEVVQALESDPSFRKKLETADVNDIKSGKIARELHFVDHNVRTKLDELKRRELERLRHLAIKEYEKETGVDRSLLKVPIHIDHKNPTRFEVEDLKKLIVKTTEDLEKVDNQRREEFKKYEMDKEFQRQQDMAAMDAEHRKQAEERHKEEVKKHAQHGKLHHPGSKQQLEEVWEQQDHMRPEEFQPKTFFHLHDLDGNGYWDEMEVKALFRKELDKMYDPNAPEDDINERYEEMERMREHVFKESDTDKDNLISFAEFLEQTKKEEFEQDSGWQGLDEQELYSEQEYEDFRHQREMEIQKLVESGAIPPPPGYHGMPPPQPAIYQGGPYPAHPGVPQVVPQYALPPQVHPNAVPQGYQPVPIGQAHPQGVAQGQAPPQQVQYIPHGAPYQVPSQSVGGQGQPPVQAQPVVPAYQAAAAPAAAVPAAAVPAAQAVTGTPVVPQPGGAVKPVDPVAKLPPAPPQPIAGQQQGGGGASVAPPVVANQQAHPNVVPQNAQH